MEIDRMIQKGPCKRCGAENYPLSTSGPDYCPDCACGNDIGRIKFLRERVIELQQEISRLKKRELGELHMEVGRGIDKI